MLGPDNDSFLIYGPTNINICQLTTREFTFELAVITCKIEDAGQEKETDNGSCIFILFICASI